MIVVVSNGLVSVLTKAVIAIHLEIAMQVLCEGSGDQAVYQTGRMVVEDAPNDG